MNQNNFNLTSKQSLKFFLNTIFWKTQIDSVLSQFSKLGYIEPTQLNYLSFEKLNDKQKWNDLDELISDFISVLPFSSSITFCQKQLTVDFIHYLFYQLAYKTYLKHIKPTFLTKTPYNADNEIAMNKLKRHYYYDFLDSFQKIQDYNVVLLELLKIVL